MLQSHTVETGAQEIAAIILVTAMLARERARAATYAPVLRIKFGVALAIVRSVWFCLGPIADLLTAQQKRQVVARGEGPHAPNAHGAPSLAYESTGRTSARHPKWPRLMQTNSVEGPLQFKVV